MKMDSKDKNKDIILNFKIKLEEQERIFNKYNIDYLSLGLKDKSKLVFFLPSLDSTLFKCEYLIKIEGIYDSSFPIQNILINMPISVYHNNNEVIKENDDFNNINIKNEGINENINNIIDNNRNEDENEKEIKTFRND